LRLETTVKVKYTQSATPQEELARNAADFRRGLRARFGDALSAEDIEDIVQTALINKAPASDDGRNSRQRAAWFARVVHHAAIDYLRARDGRNRAGRRPRQLSLNLIADHCHGDPGIAVAALRVEDDGLDAERLDSEYDAEAVRTFARRALGRLSREDRRLIGLRYRDGLSNALLAEEVGLTVKGLEKRWARVWVAFVTEAAGDAVTDEACGPLRAAIACRELGTASSEVAARWEAHLQECPACRVWQHVGSQAAGAIPMLPMGGLLASLLGKLGLGGLIERIYATTDQVTTAVGLGGGGAGAGAGVLSAIGGKAAATCITAVVCAGGAAFVAAPVVQHAADPPKQEHRDTMASKPHASAAGSSSAQRPATAVSSTPASIAPASQERLSRSS
jgi:RNA polymerase sigma factor (sigma-70 family)